MHRIDAHWPEESASKTKSICLIAAEKFTHSLNEAEG